MVSTPMSDAVEAILGVSSGFWLHQLITTHAHALYIDKVSSKWARRLRLCKRFLNQKITMKLLRHRAQFNINGRVIHLHHWISLSVIFAVVAWQTSIGLGQLTMVKTFLIGGVIQGFLYKDRFNIFPKKEK